ncbi:MAG: chorismate synthase [Vicinamibacteria bacterium]|nr:chorismate synthase [Vicinamibacteria bacterium]
MRVLTAGESHGPAVLCLVEGLPAGLEVKKDRINAELARRQRGYGRGGRMKIEQDEVEILTGIRHGLTLGSPVTLAVRNKDHANWADVMSPDVLPEATREEGLSKRERTSPRPGHADLAGALKYLTRDLRNIIERSSARDTAARVAAGMLAQSVLDVFGVEVRSHVIRIENAASESPVSFDAMAEASQSDVGCLDEAVAARMRAVIDSAKKDGDTVGGEIEMAARGLPPGIGSFAQWTQRLDGLLAQALMSIPSVKAVALGEGFHAGRMRGSAFHDTIGFTSSKGFTRPSNHAGGIEGGISNGEEIRVRAIVKPIPTLMNRLPSVDLKTLEPSPAAIERSDTCVVPAAAVVGEAMVRIVLAQALLETYGGDSRAQLLAHFEKSRDLRASTFGFGKE